jgi:16S rRNA (cytidine1402-2'-O)-methyltransferase
MNKKGQLYLLPAPLGDSGPFNLVDYTHPPFSELRHFIVEEVRSARRYLRAASFSASFDEIVFFEMGKHSDVSLFPSYLEPAMGGYNIGLLSEAGMPCIADPGSSIVELAHQKRIRVIPITGPSSIFMALAASGLNGQHFEFHGYLPLDGPDLKRKLQHLTKDTLQSGKTQIFIETPFRSGRLLESLIRELSPPLRLCLAISISQPGERIISQGIEAWKKNPLKIGKEPAVFLIGI